MKAAMGPLAVKSGRCPESNARSRRAPLIVEVLVAVTCLRGFFVDRLWAALRVEIGPCHHDAEGGEDGHNSDEHKDILGCHGHTSPCLNEHNRPMFLSF